MSGFEDESAQIRLPSCNSIGSASPISHNPLNIVTSLRFNYNFVQAACARSAAASYVFVMKSYEDSNVEDRDFLSTLSILFVLVVLTAEAIP